MNRSSLPKPRPALNGANLRKGGGRPSRRRVITEQQHAFCSAYIRLGSASGAAVYSGYHPASGYRLLENPAIQSQVRSLQGSVAQREERRAEKRYTLDREFLDLQLADRIANGETHRFRGDADRVKAMEIGYKALGVIQPSRVVAQASATATAPLSDNMLEVYEAKWLTDKKAKMATYFEQKHAGTILPLLEPGETK